MKEKFFDFNGKLFYDSLIHSTDDYIYMCYWPKNIFLFPQNMVEEFNLPSQVVENADDVWGGLIHKDDRNTFFQSIEDIRKGGTNVHNVEYRAKNRHGEWVWLRCRGYLQHDENGEPTLFAGIMTNLGKKDKIDHITGLFNKFEFENQLKLLLSRPNCSGSVLILGLDNFKHINELYNREFGDEVLRIIGQKISTLLPNNANVYRLDGDEFGIIIDNADKEQTLDIYKRIQKDFQHQQIFDNKKYYCSVSGGCSMFPQDGTDFNLILKNAEYSLAFSKIKNKNQLNFYNNEIMVKRARILEITSLIRDSVEHDFEGFEVYYQPQVDAQTRKLKGAEALLRWKSDKYGNISPEEFIPILEQTGLIKPVGEWVFIQAVCTCKEWLIRYPDFIMNVNLSYFQLDGFISFLKNTLNKYELDPSHIVIELTETYIVATGLKETFDQIRELGVKIAMDDFGTGYSSLQVLKVSPTDIVKIDRSFVKDILHSKFDATFIKSIVELCHNVQIEICLEGVETEEEYNAVSNMELDLIQGYLFGRPKPKSDFCEQYFAYA